MLKTLILKNFQIHKNFKIEFDKGFNLIRGQNDSGKSSIVRAIHWLFYNEPSGDWMCRIDGEKEIHVANVKCVFEDGENSTIIKRIKGDGRNKYIAEEDEFINFGYEIPSNVLDLLKINKFKTNKSEFNLHVLMQDDLPFLVHEPSTVKSSIIDVLTGSSIIQKGITEFNKDLLDSNKKIKNLESEISLCETNLQALPDLKILEGILVESVVLETLMNKVLLERTQLHELYEKLFKAKSILEKLENIPDTNLIEKLNDEYKNLDFVNTDLIVLSKRLEIYGKNAEIEIPELENLEDLSEKLKEKITECDYLYSRGSDFLHANSKIKTIDKELNELEKQFEQFKVCPVCERPL
jgi:exonuclease SbcC